MWHTRTIHLKHYIFRLSIHLKHSYIQWYINIYNKESLRSVSVVKDEFNIRIPHSTSWIWFLSLVTLETIDFHDEVTYLSLKKTYITRSLKILRKQLIGRFSRFCKKIWWKKNIAQTLLKDLPWTKLLWNFSYKTSNHNVYCLYVTGRGWVHGSESTGSHFGWGFDRWIQHTGL